MSSLGAWTGHFRPVLAKCHSGKPSVLQMLTDVPWRGNLCPVSTLHPLLCLTLCPVRLTSNSCMVWTPVPFGFCLSSDDGRFDRWLEWKERRWGVYPPYMWVWKWLSLKRFLLWSGSISPSPYLSWALLSSLSPVPSVASPRVLHHPLVGFLNLFTLLLIVPAITPLNEPSVSCQDPSQVNLGEMLENLQCLLAS